MENVPAFSEHALMLLHERYLRRDESGHVLEQPDALGREWRGGRRASEVIRAAFRLPRVARCASCAYPPAGAVDAAVSKTVSLPSDAPPSWCVRCSISLARCAQG
jgi:hypothetical protein